MNEKATASKKRWVNIKRLSRTKKIIALVVLVGIVIAGVLYMVLIRPLMDGNRPRGGEVGGQLVDPRTEAEREASVLLSDGLEGEGDFTLEVASQLKQLAGEAKTEEDRMAYLMSAYDIYVNLDNHQSALETALEMEAVRETPFTAGAIASAHMSLGNSEESIKYYQIAVDRSEPTSLTEESDFAEYSRLLEAAKGGDR